MNPGSANPAYVGRFAPSPTGPLHAGSLVAALASWLDARAHGGRWLVRIEDVDVPRCVPGAAETILAQLAAFGLLPDETPCVQSRRGALYEAALARLRASGWAFPCGCTRQDILQAWQRRGVDKTRHAELVYPGTCRGGLHGKPPRAVRALAASPADRAAPLHIAWHDRRLGPREQDVSRDVGDFVLKRADGLWSYQLAVVVDDGFQGVTDVVRGEDLADNTPRQIHLQRLLGWPLPRYLHTPLVRAADGEKLSKQNGAAPVDAAAPLPALRSAAATLGLSLHAATVTDLLAEGIAAWRGTCLPDAA